MQLLEHFHELSIHPKNAKELKGLILQLAVQGKLTKKWRKLNPNVEPASELLKRIKEEKQQLITEKKIKKEKPLSLITKDNIPYELPGGWVWCRFGDLITFLNGYAFKSSTYVPLSEYQIIRLGNVKNDNFLMHRKEAYVPESIGEETLAYQLLKNDILTTLTGTKDKRDYCYTCLVKEEHLESKILLLNQRVGCIRAIDKSASELLNKFLKSDVVLNQLFETETGTANQGNIGSTSFKNLVFPLPPLEEQKAIVEIVEKLFKEVEELVQLTEKRIQFKEDFVTSALHQLQERNTKEEWGYLQKYFHTFFTEENNIKKLRETILQLAVQGKLTKDWRILRQAQGTPLEPASELLERIKAEKQQLVAEKKIKKEKPLPLITEDEIPYELPEGWVWCKMQEIGLFQRGKSKHRPRNDVRLFVEGKYPLVQTGDISSAKRKGGLITTHKSSYNDFGLAQSVLWKKGTLCITIAANIAETGFLSYDACFPDSVVGFTSLIDNVTSKYVQFFVDITKSDLERYAPSTAQKNINLGILFSLNFPFPPLDEQKTIVEKVNKLMTLCDQLEEQVKASKEQSEKLMQSVLREVFTPQEKEEVTLNDLIPNIDKYMQVAMITQKMENAFGFNHGKVEKQKTSFLLKAIKKQSIPYNFEKSNYGTFSWELSEDLDSNPFLQKSGTDKGSVYKIKSNKQSDVLTALNVLENAPFVQAIDELIQIYQNPLISGKTDKIELLNTVCKLMLDLKTNDLEIVYKAMQDWQIKQNGCNTKAGKFSKKDTEKILRLVVKLGWDKDLINN